MPALSRGRIATLLLEAAMLVALFPVAHAWMWANAGNVAEASMLKHSEIRLLLHVQSQHYYVCGPDFAKLTFQGELVVVNSTRSTLDLRHIGVPESVLVGRTLQRLQNGHPDLKMMEETLGLGPVGLLEINERIEAGQRSEAMPVAFYVPVKIGTREVGLRPGKYYVAITAVAEIATGGDGSSIKRIHLQTEPILFSVASNPELEGCR
jgi:hypothetical protein